MNRNRHHAQRPTALTAADRAKVAQPQRKPLTLATVVKWFAVTLAVLIIAKELI